MLARSRPTAERLHGASSTAAAANEVATGRFEVVCQLRSVVFNMDVASAAFERSHIKTRECAVEELLSAAEAGDLETIGGILDGKMFIDVNAGQWSPRRLALDAQEHWPRWSAEAGYSALHCAAAAGHAAVCARLIERGATPHSTSRRGATPLMLACYGGHLETVECLLAHLREDKAPGGCGAALVDAMMHGVIADGDPGPSALHLACASSAEPQRSAAVVAALLRAGAAAHPAGVLRTLRPGSSYAPREREASTGPYTFSLLRAVPPTPGGGSSPKYACSLRVAPLGLLSPLHLAAAKHNAAAVRHLVAAGAWVQHAGPTGETALELAQRHAATEGAAARVLAPAVAAGGASEALMEARAQTLRELRWLPAVRTLWCVVAGAEASGARGACPLRKLTRDALRLVCAAVVAAHVPEAEGVDEAEEPEEACGPGHAEHGGEDGRAVPIDRLLMGCQLTSAD